MSAGVAMQAALVAALQTLDELTGVYDGPPARAPFPYAVVDCGMESDWSHKSGTGREVRSAVTLYDKGERPVRLRTLMGDVH